MRDRSGIFLSELLLPSTLSIRQVVQGVETARDLIESAISLGALWFRPAVAGDAGRAPVSTFGLPRPAVHGLDSDTRTACRLDFSGIVASFNSLGCGTKLGAVLYCRDECTVLAQ